MSIQTLILREGCIQLVFEVPSFIPPDIFPLTPNQKAELKDLGVIQLDCEDYHFGVHVQVYGLHYSFGPSPFFLY